MQLTIHQHSNLGFRVTGLAITVLIFTFGAGTIGCQDSDKGRHSVKKHTEYAELPRYADGVTSDIVFPLSPDLKYGVRSVTTFYESLDSISGKLTLVKVISLEDNRYLTLDSLPYASELHTFCGDGYLVYGIDDYDQDMRKVAYRVFLLEFLNTHKTKEILAANYIDSSNLWVRNLRHFDFRIEDSLLTYDEAVGADLTLAGKRYPVRVVIRRVQPDGQVPIIATIEDAEKPTFSQDGKQVLAERWIEDAPDYYTSRVVIYDIDRDTLSQLPLPLRFSRGARRLAHDSPIYYFASQSDARYCNIRVYDPATGVDSALTNVLPPDQIWQLYITANSIVYRVSTQTPDGGVQGRFRTIRLAR